VVWNEHGCYEPTGPLMLDSSMPVPDSLKMGQTPRNGTLGAADRIAFVGCTMPISFISENFPAFWRYFTIVLKKPPM